MPNSSYMPVKQADQVQWATDLNLVVGPLAAQYGIPATVIGEFSNLVSVLDEAWAAAANPATRTRGTVAAKDDALAAMKTKARQLVGLIQATPSVTDQMKRNAGLTVRKTHGTPVPPPSQKPYVTVKSIDGRNVTIELRQNASKRAKPKGVTGATIFTGGAMASTGAIGDWEFVGGTAKTTYTIAFPPSSAGDTVQITAFWTNAKNESGLAADPISINLPAGGLLPREQAERPTRLAA